MSFQERATDMQTCTTITVGHELNIPCPNFGGLYVNYSARATAGLHRAASMAGHSQGPDQLLDPRLPTTAGKLGLPARDG